MSTLTLEQEIKKTEKYLAYLKEPGFKHLLEEVDETLKVLKNAAVDECDTNDKWQVRRGQIQAFNFIGNLPAIVENRLEMLNLELEEVDVEADSI